MGKAAAQKLCAESFLAQPVLLDVTDGTSIQSTASEIDAQFGRLDILVNNAGLALEPMAKPSEVAARCGRADTYAYEELPSTRTCSIERGNDRP